MSTHSDARSTRPGRPRSPAPPPWLHAGRSVQPEASSAPCAPSAPAGSHRNLPPTCCPCGAGRGGADRSRSQSPRSLSSTPAAAECDVRGLSTRRLDGLVKLVAAGADGTDDEAHRRRSASRSPFACFGVSSRSMLSIGSPPRILMRPSDSRKTLSRPWRPVAELVHAPTPQIYRPCLVEPATPDLVGQARDARRSASAERLGRGPGRSEDRGGRLPVLRVQARLLDTPLRCAFRPRSTPQVGHARILARLFMVAPCKQRRECAAQQRRCSSISVPLSCQVGWATKVSVGQGRAASGRRPGANTRRFECSLGSFCAARAWSPL